MQKINLSFCLINIMFTVAVHAAVIKVFPGSIGAEIVEMDLSCGINNQEVEMIRNLLHERLVVVIRNQNLTAQQQVLITKQFGDVEIAWDKKNRHPDDCRVHVITNDGAKFNPQPDGVGMTGFLNAYTAYQSLLESLKEKIEPLRVIHSYDIMFNLTRKNYEKVSLEFKKGNETFPDPIHPY